jgi:glycosyltransferase involved in cell wall biosynthesis
MDRVEVAPGTPGAPARASTTQGRAARRFRVLATAGAFEPGFRAGGPVRSVARIVDTAPPPVELMLVTRDRDLGCRDPYPSLSGRWVTRARCRIFYLGLGRPRQWLRLLRSIRRRRYDLLYVNSLWSPVFTVLPVLAARLRILRVHRVLLAPRGQLSTGALSLKSTKKRLFLSLWGRLLKNLDVLWHASSEREAADIRSVFPWAEVEINSDQSGLPKEPLCPRAANIGPARMVFIGRISPMKNLELVLHALRGLSQPVEFDIYGPVEDARYWSTCQSLLDRLPANVTAGYRGELAHSAVRATFAEYDAFVFPTLGENYSHVIAESLSASCPVICSTETPWTEVLRGGGGAVLPDLTAAALTEELRRVAGMSPAERLAARRSAGEAYRSWRSRADQPNVLEQVMRRPSMRVG